MSIRYRASKLSLKRDDGIRVFLNGSEIARDNLTSGTVGASTKANNEVRKR